MSKKNPKNLSGKKFSFFQVVIHPLGAEFLNQSELTKSTIAKKLKILTPLELSKTLLKVKAKGARRTNVELQGKHYTCDIINFGG